MIDPLPKSCSLDVTWFKIKISNLITVPVKPDVLKTKKKVQVNRIYEQNKKCKMVIYIAVFVQNTKFTYNFNNYANCAK